MKNFKRDCVLIHERAEALKLLRALHALFRQAGVAYVDPLDLLRAEKGTVFLDYLHHTKQGNRLMAEATYQALKPIVIQRLAARSQHVSK